MCRVVFISHLIPYLRWLPWDKLNFECGVIDLADYLIVQKLRSNAELHGIVPSCPHYSYLWIKLSDCFWGFVTRNILNGCITSSYILFDLLLCDLKFNRVFSGLTHCVNQHNLDEVKISLVFIRRFYLKYGILLVEDYELR